MEKKYTTLETITPELAKAWLDPRINKSNRRLSDSVVEKIARDIKSGHWMVTNQGIGFAIDGTLVDGQHRLNAIVEAGVPVQCFVTRGLDLDVQSAIDRNKPRKWFDAQDMSGTNAWKSSRHVEAIVKYIHLLVSKTNASYTFHEMDDAVQRYYDGLKWLDEFLINTKYRYAPFAGALVLAFRRHPEEVDYIARKVVEPEGLFKGDPAYVLRDVVESSRGRNDSVIRRGIGLKTLRAVRARSEGSQVQLLRPTESDVEFYNSAWNRR